MFYRRNLSTRHVESKKEIAPERRAHWQSSILRAGEAVAEDDWIDHVVYITRKDTLLWTLASIDEWRIEDLDALIYFFAKYRLGPQKFVCDKSPLELPMECVLRLI